MAKVGSRCHKCGRYLDQEFLDPEGNLLCKFCFHDLLEKTFLTCWVSWVYRNGEFFPMLTEGARA